MPDLSELQLRFHHFGQAATPRAPLYARLSSAIADDPAVVSLLSSAPEVQQNPVLLFAAVHSLLLAGEGPELANYYPNLAANALTSDPYPAFRSFALAHEDSLRGVVSWRTTQTNEVGRCASFLPALGMVADECGALALVDVGTSGGLNLLLDQFGYQYLPGGMVGVSSEVTLRCATRGNVPVPRHLPPIAAAIGIDRYPIDVSDDEAARWLEACVWPDQLDRFERLVGAIALARSDPPDVRLGDAIEDLASTVEEAALSGHPVVTNSWVLNYLTGEERTRYVHTLDAIGATRDLSWVIAESPAETPELPVPGRAAATDADADEHLTVLSLVTWRDGHRTAQRLGTTHPHGFWLHWEGDRPVIRRDA
ncbi:MAG TPA: DUF2332 domain-containing protein [Ilumatobacteraceae bacterium]|nr:DUF2332 domain-containing protein [Ilumatobacteraceae bacterium]